MEKSFCDTNHILVGLGGTGGKILKAFKMRMFEEFPEAKDRDSQPVSLLYVDSTDEMMGIGRPDFRVMGIDASFTQNEFLYIKDVDVTKILDNIDNYPSVKGIVRNVSAVKTAIGSLGQAAGQKRRAGRLLFAANAVAYVNALKNAYTKCDVISHNSENTNIHIFAGLSGGTGSGAIIDAITQTRKVFPEAIISVYAMIPEINLPKANIDQGRYYQNGYAALNELNALQAGRFCPHDVTGYGSEVKLFSDRIKGVANGLTLYSNVNENGLTIDSLTELPKIVSDYIFARIFLINNSDEVNNDIIRAYTFENMDDFALEYDESKDADERGIIPIARTKKINSFGIKRVMYPELRVLKHITYSIGESVLYQFKYNNWRENFGFVNEEANVDYRQIYLNQGNLNRWFLDDKHITLESKILPTDKDYPTFDEYWHDKVIGYAEEAKASNDPLNELDDILSDFFAKQFRGVGVAEYYAGKNKAIPEIAKEIRRTIEHELFGKWKDGEISILELQRISKLLIEYISDKRKELEDKENKELEEYQYLSEERKVNVADWTNKSFLKKKVFGGNSDSFANHQSILTDFYTSKTFIEAWKFAKALAAKLFIELGKLDEDISAFGQKISEALDETERLITAQQKVNKGLEDMKGAIIEVCEDEQMKSFESDLKLDKIDMPIVARQIRDVILHDVDFVNFGNLANSISTDGIKDAFDIKLSEIVRIKHEEKADSEKKVLGLNILSQLMQKLTTDEDIQKFALTIVKQSGVYLKLNNDQMQLHVRNNEGNLSPSNPASINKKTILVSIPSPEDSDNLKRFADKLEKAFKNSFSQGNSQTTLVINKKSPRKDELSIVTIAYCFPMRAISWVENYKEKYETFMNTGNINTDKSNAILIHSEGDGKDLPSLFVLERQSVNDAVFSADNHHETVRNTDNKFTCPVLPPSIINEEIKLQLFIAVNGQQYGPYDNGMCKQMVVNGQLTKQSLVWKQGMTGWELASNVPDLQFLFAADTLQMPPIPPVNNMVPPIIK